MMNLVSREKAEQIGHVIHTVDNVDAVSFGGSHTRFYGYMTDVPIEVSGVMVLSFIYVIKMINNTYDIILRALF